MPENGSLYGYTSDTDAFWRAALDVVNEWASYQRVKQLLINATHSETRHKVQKVVDKYYGGSIKQLRDTEAYRSKKVDMALQSFLRLCERHDVRPVDRDWAYHKLRDKKDYGRYRAKIKRRLDKSAPAQSLWDL